MGGINGMHSGTVAVLLVQSTLCSALHYITASVIVLYAI